MYRFIFLFIISCFLSFNTIAQKTYKLTDLFIQAIEGDSAVVTSHKDSISTEGLMDIFDVDLYAVLSEKGYTKDESGRIIVNNYLELNGVIISKSMNSFTKIRNFHFKYGLRLNFKRVDDNQSIGIGNSVFKGPFINLEANHNITINDSKFFKSPILYGSSIVFKNNSVTNNKNFKMQLYPSIFPRTLTGSSGDEFKLDSIAQLEKKWGRKLLNYTSSIEIRAKNNIDFTNNIISDDFNHLVFSGKVDEISISGNTINGIANFSNLIIAERLTFNDNTFKGYLDISTTVFPEVYRKIRWSKNSDFKLVVSTNTTLKTTANLEKILSRNNFDNNIQKIAKDTFSFKHDVYYIGKTQEEVKDDLIYDLKASYQKLSEIYKENADQQAANWAYAEMMNLEGKRLKEVYKEEKNFRNFFRWQLNSLMKVYTNHGTDPGLAITISMYVILFFAVIYFFFPSEWDVTSKSKLIKDFKNFREKNDKGYLIPFLNVVMGLVISLVNAITLSLNSFTTLGFGNIPTKGLARYLTIIQGFVGWFLLGLFSVSLINQVLA